MNTNGLPHLAVAEQRLQLCCHSVVELHLADGARTQRGSFESSRLRPRGLAWLEPSWCDSVVSQARVCAREARAGVCTSQRAPRIPVPPGSLYRLCVRVRSELCARLYVYVCVCSRLLPPTGWSFTFRTGRRDRRLPGCARSLGTVRLSMPGIH